MSKRNRFGVIAMLLVAMVMIFAACEGESPTAPNPGSGGSGGGGTTPPTGAAIALAVSDRNPELNGASVITATVTQGGAAVPNGTAVEFVTNLGVFAESGTNVLISTTTAGVARATLTSPNPGAATITVRVNNVNATTTVTFGAAGILIQVSNPNPPVGGTTTITVQLADPSSRNGTPVLFSTDLGIFTESNASTVTVATNEGIARATLTSTTAGRAIISVTVFNVTATTEVVFGGSSTTTAITSVTPTTGKPAGGQTVIIRGRGFDAPVRVLFGDVPAQIVSVTSTEIIVIAPRIDLGATEQGRDVLITVIAREGTSTESRATSPTPYRVQLDILTPKIYNVSPASGPNEGNTRITIFGEGFQAPLRAYFGKSAGSNDAGMLDQVELEVVHVTFNQVIAVTPPALGLGRSLQNSQVFLGIKNIASNTWNSYGAAFRYGPEMQITAISPTQGPSTGGTRVTIYGWGFDDPVAVSLAGVAAQVIRVSGTEIVVMSSAASGCGAAGEVIVTNIEDGTQASGPEFAYLAPRIIAVSPTRVQEEGTVTITVANATATNPTRFTIGGRSLPPSTVVAGSGVVTYTVTLTPPFEYPSTSCTIGTATGTRFGNLIASVEFNDLLTGCKDTLSGGLTITPNPLTNPCVAAGAVTVAPASAAFTGTCGGTSNLVPITVTNTGGTTVTVTAIASALTGFTTTGTFPTTILPGANSIFQASVALPATRPASPVAGNIALSLTGAQTPAPINATVTCTAAP